MSSEIKSKKTSKKTAIKISKTAASVGPTAKTGKKGIKLSKEAASVAPSPKKEKKSTASKAPQIKNDKMIKASVDPSIKKAKTSKSLVKRPDTPCILDPFKSIGRMDKRRFLKMATRMGLSEEELLALAIDALVKGKIKFETKKIYVTA